MAYSKHDEPKHDDKQPAHKEEVTPKPTVHGKLVSETQNAYVVADASGNETTVFKTEGMTVTGDSMVVTVPPTKEAANG